MSNYNRIILKERVRIEAGIYAKKSFGEIAEELGRSTSSITREVKQNRIMVKSPYACGTDCVYPPNCRKTGLCGDEYCTKRCWTCTEHDCTQYCDRCVTHTCKKTEKAPFVCDSCSEKNKKLMLVAEAHSSYDTDSEESQITEDEYEDEMYGSYEKMREYLQDPILPINNMKKKRVGNII